MAISMVRKPSETSNITNIDDIIPFRYAYGNQNGYVIGKGTELSYTINANTFRVNSGRVVLQGVESDVDANGVELVVDIASETRYYVVYYQVNLATNSTNILLSNYDTAGYPTIDLGDDLTVNSSGIARLPLYRFSVANGVIGNIEKVVKEIQYIKKDITVENAENINGLNLKRDDNDVLRIGDFIIPQKKLIYSGSTARKTFELTEEVSEGDVLEIHCYEFNANGGEVEPHGTTEQCVERIICSGIVDANEITDLGKRTSFTTKLHRADYSKTILRTYSVRFTSSTTLVVESVTTAKELISPGGAVILDSVSMDNVLIRRIYKIIE